MLLKNNKGFTLFEVLVALAVLSTAIVFVFRSFTTSLLSARFSQNITLACFLAEDKIWELEEEQKSDAEPIKDREGVESIQGRDFKWACKLKKPEGQDLIYAEFTVSWQEKNREKEYSLQFDTYFLPGQA